MKFVDKKKMAAGVVIIGITLASIGLIETAAGIYYDNSQKELEEAKHHLLSGGIEAYENSPYQSAIFKSNLYHVSSKFYTPKDTRLILPIDYESEFINIIEGNRQTIPQERSQRKIYIFGGSTIFCGEVPDYFTIPSLFSYLTKENNIGQYEVINKGVTSVNSSQQVAYLKTLKLQSDDIVIFYDGVNDILQGLYFGAPEGTIIGEQRKIKNRSMQLSNIKLISNSSTFKVLRDIFGIYAPAHLKNPHSLSVLKKKLITQYVENIQEAHTFTQASEANFYHFLQPNIFSLTKHSSYEKLLTMVKIPKAQRLAFEIGNPLLLQAHKQITAEGIDSKDLSDILNNKEEECFLDGFHVTELCNLIIADEIFKNIFGENMKTVSRGTLDKINSVFINKHHPHFNKVPQPSNLEPLVQLTNFSNVDMFFGQFDKEKLKEENLLLSGDFISSIIPLKTAYEISITTECHKDNGAFLMLNFAIQAAGTRSMRWPLKCGLNTFHYKSPLEVETVAYLIQSNQDDFKITSITINSAIFIPNPPLAENINF
jgi:hypothetical protein